MNIKNVYIYGSAAKGRITEDSDIDIAVVGDDFIGDPVEDTFKLMKLRRKVDIRIEPQEAGLFRLFGFSGPVRFFGYFYKQSKTNWSVWFLWFLRVL